MKMELSSTNDFYAKTSVKNQNEGATTLPNETHCNDNLLFCRDHPVLGIKKIQTLALIIFLQNDY